MHVAPHVWVPKHNPLWYPGRPHVGGVQLPVTLDDIAGKPLEPSEYAALLDEIRDCTKIGRGVKLGRGTKLGKVGVPYTPLDEGNGRFWHDMQDAASYTTASGDLSSITNKVSAVTISQATASARAAFSATGFNSQPCADYDGSSDVFVGTESAVYEVFDDDNPYTLFYSAKHDVADKTDYVFGCGNASSATGNHRGWGGSTTGTGRWIAAANTSAAVAANVESSTANNTTAAIFEWFHTGAAVSLSINGGGANPNAVGQSTGALSLGKFSVGVRSRGATDDGFHDGLIGEILLYAVELGSSARSRVRQYMGTRWVVTVTP